MPVLYFNHSQHQNLLHIPCIRVHECERRLAPSTKSSLLMSSTGILCVFRYVLGGSSTEGTALAVIDDGGTVLNLFVTAQERSGF